MDKLNYKGSVLISGCSSGIGKTTAYGLRKRGYRVFATARKNSDINQLIKEGFETFRLDLADSSSIQEAVNLVFEKTGGKLDALFNNAAFGQPGAVEDLSRDVLRNQFETNFFGTHELTNLVLPKMREQGHGRILYNSSVLGLVALTFRGAYNASKFALEGLADTLRMELYNTNIKIILIEPGPILSNFRQNSFELYKKHIRPESSPYRKVYQLMEERLTHEGAAVPFTLPPEAVLQKVILALESPKPKIRYYVTVPTYLFAGLRRALPHRALDWCLRRI
ncbi:MAG: SDR family NAD(P)-dependent oxidoreductase [Methylococcales bacterium]